MALETWGDKPKSQVDNTLIDAEIDAKIQDHDDDPDSHLDAGQALQSHKASEIIDHIVGSVLADKLTMTEISGTTFFESLDMWDKEGNIAIDLFPGLRLNPEWGYTNTCFLISTLQVPSEFLSSYKNILFQTMVRFDGDIGVLNAWFGYLHNYLSNNAWFGFQVRAGVLYCHYYLGADNYDVEVSGVDLSLDHLYRVQYNAITRTIEWYFDGALVASFTIAVGSYWGTDVGPSIGITLTEVSDLILYCGFITFAREL